MDSIESVANNFSHPSDDIAWIDFIWDYIIKFYNSFEDKANFIKKSENEITEDLYFWLINTKRFNKYVCTNSQPRTDNTQVEGYYDLKFQSNFWRENDIYYAIENKILDGSSTSIKEYTYSPNKSKGKGENKTYYDDGGMYRFLSNKYAENMSYGGMLAFIKKDNVAEILDKVKEKIRELDIPNNNKYYGKLLNSHTLNIKIQGFEYSFITNHTRKNKTNIELRHLCFVFN